MRINVITLFPEFVSTIQDYGVVGRALRANIVNLQLTNPRDYAQDANARVDERPYGGGPGMVMQFAPLARAIDDANCMSASKGNVSDQALEKKLARVVYLSPQGQTLDQSVIKRFSRLDHLVLICGRYEGIDERLIESRVDEEWSIGDYVISGGELAAMIVIDAIVRTLPGALGDELSALQESFERGLLDCPHYTRPEKIEGYEVPQELISGDHEKIASWRLKQMLGRTYQRRPDMIEKLELTDQEQQLLAQYLAETE